MKSRKLMEMSIGVDVVIKGNLSSRFYPTSRSLIDGNGRIFCPYFYESSSVLCRLMAEMRRVSGESLAVIRSALHLSCDSFLASTVGKDLSVEGGGIGLILIKISLDDNVF